MAEIAAPSEVRRSWSALGLLAVLIFAWGGNYTWIKLALSDIGPWTFNAARFCGAALIVGLVLLLKRGPRHLLPVRGERTSLAIIGLLPGAVLTVLITASLMWIKATHTILLIYTNPIWTLIFSVLILDERFTFFNVAGVGLGLFGMLLLINPLALEWQSSTLPGIGAAVTGAVAWALGSVLYRRRTWRSTFWQQVFWQLTASGLLTALCAALFEGDHAFTPSARLALITLYNVLIPTALAFWCWSQALSRIKASTASQVLLLSPVFGVAQSHVLLGEPLTDATLASGAAIITGACLTLLHGASRRKPKAAAR